MKTQKLISIILSLGFIAYLLVPTVALAKDTDKKADAGEGCKNFTSQITNICKTGLICQIEDTDPNDCGGTAEAPAAGPCDGTCRSITGSEAQYGIGTGSQFRDTGIGKTSDLKGTIASIINIALGFLGIVAVIFIIFGGFKMMTAAGNEEQTASGKQAVVGGVIGLIIIFAAWAIASFVIGQLGSATAQAPTAIGKCAYDDNNTAVPPAAPAPCDNNKCNNGKTQAQCLATETNGCATLVWTEGESC